MGDQRLSAGGAQLRPDLRSVVSEVAEQFGSDAERKGILFKVGPVPPYLVRTDPDALRRILINLVGNAIKYTPASANGQRGEVSLAFQLNERSMQILVEDTGIGIPADMLQAVFQPYVQLDSPARNRKKGFGFMMQRHGFAIQSTRSCWLIQNALELVVFVTVEARV